MFYSKKRLYCVLLVLFVFSGLYGCSSSNNEISSTALNDLYLGTGKDFIINIGDHVFFDFNSSSINQESKNILEHQAFWLTAYPNYNIIIEGHTDERGTREYNLALGQRRAVAVREYLIFKGVSSNRISTVSYGKERPEFVCDDDSCWSKNRRAITIVQ